VGKKKERKKSHASKLPRNSKKQKELKMEKSENINEIAEAIALAQAEIQNPAKDSENPFFKSKYADPVTLRTRRTPCLRHADKPDIDFRF
jgi:hypothetical protein